jgi:hypothetical protein
LLQPVMVSPMVDAAPWEQPPAPVELAPDTESPAQ